MSLAITIADLEAARGAEWLAVFAAAPDGDGDGDSDADGGYDETRLARAIAAAIMEAESYLSMRYALPLVGEAAQNLKPVIVDIIFYQFSASADLMSDDIKDRYKQRVAYLRDLAAGRAHLTGAALRDGPLKPAGPVLVEPGRRVFAGSGSKS